MNILYQHRTLADGAEGIHIHEMVEAFRSLGHQVRMQALASPAAAGQGAGARSPRCGSGCRGRSSNPRSWA